MRKIILIITMILLLNIAMVSAHEHNAEEAEALIDSEISCDELTDEQFEMIGDYYMEQMHPGEAHEMMDEMMGSEGSESLKQMHINMAEMIYCGEGEMMDSNGMMNMIMGGGNMMDSGGMMNMMGSGMMGSSFWWIWMIVGALFWIAVFVVLVLLIIWLYKKIIDKDSGSAGEILKKRFAQGEISKKEFESMKKEIR